MKKYRKKPVVIEAAQWDGTAEGATPIINWVLEGGGTARYTTVEPTLHSPHCRCDGRGIVPGRIHADPCPETELTGGGAATLAIDTLEGTMRSDANDWIICGVQGEFYPCKPDIFEVTYTAEPVDGECSMCGSTDIEACDNCSESDPHVCHLDGEEYMPACGGCGNPLDGR